MISFQHAYDSVLSTAHGFGDVLVPLSKADGRVLAEDILADRDFPPFDRATRDGIAIQIGGEPKETYEIQGVAAAGAPQLKLKNSGACHEIMTGAIVPENANAVVMYEHLEIKDGKAKINFPVTKGQNIHPKGSDEPKGSVLLKKGAQITPAEIGILASVGKTGVLVKRNPKITLFSTGDELVSVGQTPKMHQIRQSNSHTLRAALLENGIASEIVHVIDNEKAIKTALITAMETSDVILLSGGVSRGKFDFLPKVLDALGVQKQFHRVLQRPGKPFWFGKHLDSGTTIFGFPGNPTSTFTNFHVYFMAWLNRCFGRPNAEFQVILKKGFENTTDLTRFIGAMVVIKEGQLLAHLVHGNGSGDLTSLTRTNGFVMVDAKETIAVNDKVTFVPTRKIV
ncbi:MAG: molybdopterin molybdotransferase MoeA [Bacteroidota bacterium]